MNSIGDRLIQKSAFLFLLFLPIIAWISYLSFFILLFCLFYRHKFRYIPLNRYGYGFLGAVFLSCIFSIHKSLSLGAFAIFLCYFLSYFIFVNIELPREKVVRAIVLSGIILAVIGITFYLTDFRFSFEHEFFRIRLSPWSSTLGNANRFAQYLVLTTPIGFAALLFQSSLKEKVLPLLFMPLSFFSLWITQSLAGIVATFIALLIVLWIKNKWIALLVFVISMGFYSVNYKKVNRLTSSSSTTVRVNTLKYIVPKIFKGHPVTGCGLGTYREAAQKYDKEKRGLHYHAHNMYAHYLCETGILGLSAFLFFLGMFFYYSIKFFTHRIRGPGAPSYPLVLGGIASILGLLMHGIAETCIDYLQIGLSFFSIIGIVAGLSYRNSTTSANTS